MSRIGRLFGSLTRQSAPALSVRGGAPLEEQYLQALLTNTLGNTFYLSQRELLAEAALLHDQMVARDPRFAASALAYTRLRGLVRAQPVFGLAKLASVKPPHLEAAFGSVVLTPHDLSDFTSVVKLLRASEGGRRLKRLGAEWLLEKLDEPWVMKYGSGRDGYSLRDLFRIYHPKAGARLPLIDYLLGKAADLSRLPQIAALERLKRAHSDEERAAAIREARLPHEVVTPFARGKAVWSALVPQLPMVALLRHLATLERQGATERARSAVESRLQNEKLVAHSKILPFRFLEAERQARAPWLKEALRAALELSCANVPAIQGSTAVLLDRSGSNVRTAAMLAVSLLKKAEGRLLVFDDRLDELAVSKEASLLAQAMRVTGRAARCADAALPMKQLLSDRQPVDNLVLITDEPQTLFREVLDEYRRKVKADVRVFILAPAGHAPDPLSWLIYGWSGNEERALTVLSMVSRGFGDLVEAIRSGIN